MTNILYTLFDVMVAFGRFIGIIFMIFFAMFLLGFFVLQIFVLAGAGIGGATFIYWTENPPEFFQEFLKSQGAAVE
jgi:hypothetical protein